MKNILRVIFVICFAVLLIDSAIAQQPVPPPPSPVNDEPANAAVLKLLQVGMPESVVLDKIRAITDKFDTSIDALIALKQAGATEAELKAILAQGAAPTVQPPAAPPADTGPSLAETMRFIQEKLNDNDKISFIEFFQHTNDGNITTDAMTYETSNVVADQSSCRISYHRKGIENGSTFGDENYVFLLRDVQEIVVRSEEQDETEFSAKNGHPNIIATSTSPPTTVLKVLLPHNDYYTFRFTDANLADRVAKAMLHSVELCGGGSKDKF
jgi:hypothetical protein